MLYGVSLFINGRITLKALNSLFKSILNKKEQMEKIIQNIFDEHQIKVIIISPFENLFGNITTNENEQHLAKRILDTLALDHNEVEPPATSQQESEDTDERKQKEKNLVARCINMLSNNSYYPIHCAVWQDFIRVTDTKKVNTIEDLLKIGNAAIIGIASRDTEDCATCTFILFLKNKFLFQCPLITNYLKQKQRKVKGLLGMPIQ